jgi:hypothetical protein
VSLFRWENGSGLRLLGISDKRAHPYADYLELADFYGVSRR